MRFVRLSATCARPSTSSPQGLSGTTSGSANLSFNESRGSVTNSSVMAFSLLTICQTIPQFLLRRHYIRTYLLQRSRSGSGRGEPREGRGALMPVHEVTGEECGKGCDATLARERRCSCSNDGL